MNENNNIFEKIKIMTLGSSGVGKTSFILRITDGIFKHVYTSTIGFNFKIKNLKLQNEEIIKIYFYDTAGQDKFRSIPTNFIKNAEGILLMYDITDRKSFESITNWIEDIKEKKENNFPIILIGNKTDLEHERQVSKEEGEKVAEKYGYIFFETSNKDGINVEESFLNLTYKILEKRGKEIKINHNKKLDKKKFKKNKKKRKC